MTFAQIIILSLIGLALVLFIWDRIRFDFVALSVLLVGVILKVIPVTKAFDGFGHPAVITVASVLILSKALGNSGVTDMFSKALEKIHHNFVLFSMSLCFIAVFLSSFMNNVGALALLMPVAINATQKMGKSPSLILMPLAFASILGGLTTLIGTPPNIIISAFRARSLGAPFGMFDFAPVGLMIAVIGALFISLIGWRLIPKNRTSPKTLYDLVSIDTYVTELELTPQSPFIEQVHAQIEQIAKGLEIDILGLIRNGHRYLVTPQNQKYQAGDILIVEADAEEIHRFADKYKLLVKGSDERSTKRKDSDTTEDLEHIEVTVASNTTIEGRVVEEIGFNRRYGVNLLAVARQGQPYKGRLRSFKIQVGDVLLLEGKSELLSSLIWAMKLMPLARRSLNITGHQQFWKSLIIFLGAVGLTVSGVLSAAISFMLGALLMVLTKAIPRREFYEAIDWPIIILLGSMIPIAEAFESTGAAAYVVKLFLEFKSLSPTVIVAIVLVVTMLLTDIMNNSATSLIMAPLAISIAQKLEVSPDTFLMAVAVGSSCSFLTPIGHQNNALVLGPGGYKFGDYWRLGLPLDVLIIIIGIPMILYVWPLHP